MEKPFDLEKLGEGLYFLDYPFDYPLGEMLGAGVKNTFDLARFVQKKSGLRKKPRLKRGGFACTVFHAESGFGDELLGRNFDYKAGPSLVVRTAPKDGFRSISVTAMNVMLYGSRFKKPEKSSDKRLFLAPFCPMDGINEKGLAIAVLELRAKATKQKSGKSP